ncbi:MAG: T9SS type A sorting domain-containing protein [Flavipsychrobacter sp.]|nr:T9SS type A sorting domain-containing protein [Flavipsychrobacter sp.]
MLINFTSLKAQIPTAGLLIHFPFSGNAKDASGKAHHGNINDVKPVNGKQGISNTAYLFDTVTSFIGVPYKSDMNVSKISMCAVMKPKAFYTGPCQGNFIISRGIQGTNGSLILDYLDNGYNDCSVADTNLYVFAGQAGPIVLPATTTQCSVKVRTNTWYCYILTFDGDTARHYINGTLINKFAGWSSIIGSSTDSICIGKYPWGGSSFPYNFIGTIDDIAIYNRALSDSEISNYCTKAPLIGVEDTTDNPDTTTNAALIINNQSNTVYIYPNPNEGHFSVSGTLNAESVNFEIYNTVGTLVHKSAAKAAKKNINTTLDVKHLPNGMYILEVLSENHTQTIRFIKR